MMRTLTTMLLFSFVPMHAGSLAETLSFSLTEKYTLNSFPGEGNFANISDIAYDFQTGELLVADPGRSRVYIFKSDGSPEKILGISSDLPSISRIVPGTGGKLFIIESSTGKIFTLNREGDEELIPFSMRGDMIMDEVRVKGMARSLSGKLYLVGIDGKSLMVCDDGGRFIRKNDSRVKLKNFISMTFDSRGRLLVATKNMIPLRLYDESGEFSREITVRDFSTTLVLSEIGGVAVDLQGRIWLSYPVDGLIKVFDETGTHLADIDKNTVPGGLFSPTDIELTAAGDVIFLERGANSIRCFSVEAGR